MSDYPNLKAEYDDLGHDHDQFLLDKIQEMDVSDETKAKLNHIVFEGEHEFARGAIVAFNCGLFRGTL